MDQTYKKSSFIITALIFLLPIFFVPGGIVGLDVGKLALLALGVVVAGLLFLLEVWKGKRITIPWHPFMLVAVLLPIVYFVSAFLTTPSSLSLFGYNFEVGTFGYMLLASSLLVIITFVFNDTAKVLKAITAFLASFVIVALFVAVKIMTGGAPEWGVFFGNVGNSIGRWTDLAVAMGLLSIFSILVIGMLPMEKTLRILSYAAFVLSTIMLVVLNFSIALVLTLIASAIFIALYFKERRKFSNMAASTDAQTSSGSLSKSALILSVILGLVSLILIINPKVSESQGNLADVIANRTGVVNAEVRPSFSATLSISKAALSQDIFLGSGPNTFSQDWLAHKPTDVNTTPFWSVAFPFGAGFLPTQVPSTGIVGSLLWLAFFVILLITGIGVLVRMPDSRAPRFILLTTFISVVYLWASSFIYAPSPVILTLAFTFTGLFFASSRQFDFVRSRTIELSRDIFTKTLSSLLIGVAALGFVAVLYVAGSKTISTFYYTKAVNLVNANASLEDIEVELNNSLQFSPADIHYVALSRVNLSKAQQAATATEGTQADNLKAFETAISTSISMAQLAVSANPAGYQNWLALGSVYSSLVPPPLSVPGAYENAKTAFERAKETNPSNPEVLLFQAQMEIDRGENELARSLIREAIALKPDYVDAYLALARDAIQNNDIATAISSAEKVASLIPDNPAVHFELGLLKYSTGDFQGAGGSFIAALNLAPDYANAKYYLGLVFVRLNETDNAKRMFEDLLATNPESQEVKLILDKLNANENIFEETNE